MRVRVGEIIHLAAGMRISALKSEAVVLCPENMRLLGLGG